MPRNRLPSCMTSLHHRKRLCTPALSLHSLHFGHLEGGTANPTFKLTGARKPLDCFFVHYPYFTYLFFFKFLTKQSVFY